MLVISHGLSDLDLRLAAACPPADSGTARLSPYSIFKCLEGTGFTTTRGSSTRNDNSETPFEIAATNGTD